MLLCSVSSGMNLLLFLVKEKKNHYHFIMLPHILNIKTFKMFRLSKYAIYLTFKSFIFKIIWLTLYCITVGIDDIFVGLHSYHTHEKTIQSKGIAQI